jgi:8-oxo-dGTP diphosphatase
MIYKYLLKLWRLVPENDYLQGPPTWLINQKFLIGVSGLVLNEAGEILVLKHTYRKRFPWGLPGGMLKKSEQPSEALQREIAEETGLIVRVERLLSVKISHRWPSLDIVFLCRLEGGVMTPSAEVSEGGFYAPDALPELMSFQKRIVEAWLEGN